MESSSAYKEFINNTKKIHPSLNGQVIFENKKNFNNNECSSEDPCMGCVKIRLGLLNHKDVTNASEIAYNVCRCVHEYKTDSKIKQILDNCMAISKDRMINRGLEKARRQYENQPQPCSINDLLMDWRISTKGKSSENIQIIRDKSVEIQMKGLEKWTNVQQKKLTMV